MEQSQKRKNKQYFAIKVIGALCRHTECKFICDHLAEGKDSESHIVNGIRDVELRTYIRGNEFLKDVFAKTILKENTIGVKFEFLVMKPGSSIELGWLGFKKENFALPFSEIVKKLSIEDDYLFLLRAKLSENQEQPPEGKPEPPNAYKKSDPPDQIIFSAVNASRVLDTMENKSWLFPTNKTTYKTMIKLVKTNLDSQNMLYFKSKVSTEQDKCPLVPQTPPNEKKLVNKLFSNHPLKGKTIVYYSADCGKDCADCTAFYK